jgi:uncharacterized protein
MELTFFLDHQCNLRCTYCYTGEKFSRRMSEDVIARGIELALAQSPRHLDVSFFGGEPLLAFDRIRYAEEYLARALARTAPLNPSLRWVVNTNAVLLTEETLAWLAPPRNASVVVSLDGPPDVHDRYRLNSAGKGTHASVLKGLDKLREREVPFQLVAVINPDTSARLGNVVEALAPLGATRITLSPNFRAEWTDASLPTLRAGLQAAANVWADSFRRGTPLQLEPFHSKVLTHLRGGMPCPARCQLGGAELCVAPSGRLYPCAQMVGEDKDSSLVMGDVFQGLDLGRIRALQHQKDRVEDTCEACELRDRCQSHCGCRHVALSGELGVITAALCEFEEAVITAADRAAAQLVEERCPAFLDYYYRPDRFRAAPGAVLTPLRRSRTSEI